MLLDESKEEGMTTKRNLKSDESEKEQERYSHPQLQIHQRPILRLMFGQNEKFLFENNFNNEGNPFSLDNSHNNGSAPSSQRFM